MFDRHDQLTPMGSLLLVIACAVGLAGSFVYWAAQSIGGSQDKIGFNCPNCGRNVPPGKKACGSCGHRFRKPGKPERAEKEPKGRK